MDKKKYPIGPEHYTLYEEVGQGVSASVHRALCIRFDEVVAIKILDFERDNCDLNSVSREAQTMILVDHPNVLKSHCSFVCGHSLWVVMPYMAGGSCLHILKAAYPDGFEETVIATILREVLKGLEYLHHHGHIHRDVKAGNVLIDSKGAVKLGDFGVSACLFDSGDRQRVRNTFVGTPCWMAPEVMEQLHGYDFKADIWSFGITALELAHGHAPFSKYPPMKVLLMTLQSAPPGLDYERDRKFSKSFKQMIASCLVKDPSKRPSAKKLLRHSFFRQARSNDYILRKLLDGLPDLGDRIVALKKKEQDMLAQKKMPDGEKEEISQNEYKRGISGWNFNLDDMKAQASLIQDGDECIYDSNQDGSSNSLSSLDSSERQLSRQVSCMGQAPEPMEMPDNEMLTNQSAVVPSADSVSNPSEVIRDQGEKSDDDLGTVGLIPEHVSEKNASPRQCENVQSNYSEKSDVETGGRVTDGVASFPRHMRGDSSFSNNLAEVIPPSSGVESETLQNNQQIMSNSNGFPPDDVLSELPSRIPKSAATNSDDGDEKVKVPVVQQKGRFKVTSENVGMEKAAPSPVLQKSHSMQVIAQHTLQSASPLSPVDIPLPGVSGASLLPMLHSVLQANIHQREFILKLMKQITASESTVNQGNDGQAHAFTADKSMLETAHDREKELLHEITELQWRLICAQDEIQKIKSGNPQI